jgi:hypothetical protein
MAIENQRDIPVDVTKSVSQEQDELNTVVEVLEEENPNVTMTEDGGAILGQVDVPIENRRS